MSSDKLADPSTRGDFLGRDAYLRGCVHCSTDSTITNKYYAVDSDDSTVTAIATESVSTLDTGAGRWEVYTKPVGDTLDTTTQTPVLSSNTDTTTITSTTISLAGKVEVADSDSGSVKLTSDGIEFSSSWRIVFDSAANGLAIEENINGSYVRRFLFTHT